MKNYANLREPSFQALVWLLFCLPASPSPSHPSHTAHGTRAGPGLGMEGS